MARRAISRGIIMKGLKLGNRRCTCSTCGEFFNSVSAFDKHRSGPWTNRTCLTADQMKDVGMIENAAGYWVTSINPRFLKNEI